MYKQRVFRYLFFIITICLAACSDQSLVNDSVATTPEQPSTDIAITTQSTPTPPLELTPPTSSVPMVTPRATESANLTMVPTATNVPTLDSSLRNDCPVLAEPTTLPFWSRGSLLFAAGRIFNEYQVHNIAEELGIWAISVGDLTPQMVYESADNILISRDGTTLLSIVQEEIGGPQEIVLYNMISEEETNVTASNDSYLFTELWAGEQVRYGNVVERTEGIGEKREVIIPDPNTRSVEVVIEDLNLPDFAFNDSELDQGTFQGYESIDPTGQLILYTAHRNNGNGFEVRLLDLETGEIIWRHDTQYLPDAIPQWAEDGSRVLFIVNIPIAATHHGWWKIISLTREGQVEEFPLQPLPFTEKGQLNHYSRSSDGRYLFYTAWEVDSQTLTSENRAFIVDLMTGEVGEICDSETVFIASVPARGDKAGHWLPDNQFIYRVLIEKEGQLTHSLRVLDIPSWTAQVIFEAEPGQGVNVFGWTPVEFP